MFVPALLAVLFFNFCSGHSWLACTDYLEENGDYWKVNLCRAYARHGHQFTPKNNFGIDTGYNYRIDGKPDNQACRTGRDDAKAYNNDYPMAVYYPGQKIVLAHPMKNHAAETCTNRYIPDTKNIIWRSGTNPGRDPTISEFRRNRVVDLGVSPHGHHMTNQQLKQYPKIGYQNSPKFCENMDKALATFAYILPSMPPGRYTFMWEWEFNRGEIYSTCWEADVVANRGERDKRLQSRRQGTNDPG